MTTRWLRVRSVLLPCLDLCYPSVLRLTRPQGVFRVLYFWLALGPRFGPLLPLSTPLDPSTRRFPGALFLVSVGTTLRAAFHDANETTIVSEAFLRTASKDFFLFPPSQLSVS